MHLRLFKRGAFTDSVIWWILTTLIIVAAVIAIGKIFLGYL